MITVALPDTLEITVYDQDPGTRYFLRDLKLDPATEEDGKLRASIYVDEYVKAATAFGLTFYIKTEDNTALVEDCPINDLFTTVENYSTLPELTDEIHVSHMYDDRHEE